MYHQRLLEAKLSKIKDLAKIILILGARQVGKSTLLAHCFPKYQNILFDPVQDLYGAKADPELFLNNSKAPLILDEIQYVPELLPVLKRKVDASDAKGQYFLTGSQNISVMRNIAESLAGRVAILQLGPMSTIEIANIKNDFNWLESYLSAPENFIKEQKTKIPISYTLFEMMWRGGLPGILEIPTELATTYFSSYVQTYIERDVRIMDNIKDLYQFDRFISIVSALTAQEINHTHLAREIGLAPATAKHWLDILTYSYQWHEVWPYSGNSIKRISKKRKGYFQDTGLACYLQRISTPDALARHPQLGAMFETYIANNIFRLSTSLNLAPHFYHWRTNGGAEVDLILERDGYFYPIEIKCKTSLNKLDTRGIRSFKETYSKLNIKPGLIIYAGEEPYLIDKDIYALPWNCI